MLFNSHAFLFCYLPVVSLVFFVLCRRHLVQAAKTWLFLSSLFFYGYWDVRFLPLLLGSILFNYACGNLILKSITTPKSKIFLILGITGDLALLFYFKYSNFFISNFISGSSTFAEIVLPLGISFFTFTQIAFLVDVYKQKAHACDPISYGLFVTVFPHLIAGPILHHKQMIKQFNDLRMYVLQWPNIAQGTFLFVLGLSKKVFIADTLSEYVKPIFDDHLAVVHFVPAWFGALAYTLQLYFDFSGYSDMAVGLGLLFNLNLPINFNSPYKAHSIIDFWRRWHMTLSAFLKDYLYIPLGGSRNGKTSHLLNLMLTMLLGGLWHGAGWTFVLWGAAHGFFLVVNHLWKDLNLSLPNFAAKALTLLAVVFAWVIFRSPDVSTAQNILEGMFGFNGIGLPLKYEHTLGFLTYVGVFFRDGLQNNVRISDLLIVLSLLPIVLFTPNSNEWLLKFKRNPQRWAYGCAGVFIFCVLCMEDMAEFLYYQF
jgi:alginate O-acetyltransferase complex protein AlgI